MRPKNLKVFKFSQILGYTCKCPAVVYALHDYYGICRHYRQFYDLSAVKNLDGFDQEVLELREF